MSRSSELDPPIADGPVAAPGLDPGGSDPETGEVPALPSVIADGPVAAPGLDPGGSDPETGEAPALPSDTVRDEDMRHPLIVELLLDPARWQIWPAIAVLRWLFRRTPGSQRRIVYRSRPSLAFPSSEIDDVAITMDGVELTLNAPGLAAAGSSLPTADVARVIGDRREGGAMAVWLDVVCDRFMHAAEASLLRFSAAYALATGGRIKAVDLSATVVGRSAPLAAAGGALFSPSRRRTEGALGLAAPFVGPISAGGLAGLFRAYTGLAAHVEEFAGAEVTTLWPARVGAQLRMILGSSCRLPSAGVEIHVEGGNDPEAQEWARAPARRRSLYFLASSYIGSSLPAPRVYLHLEPDNAPPAAFDGNAALGGLAVLGEADQPVSLPLAGTG